MPVKAEIMRSMLIGTHPVTRMETELVNYRQKRRVSQDIFPLSKSGVVNNSHKVLGKCL